MVTQETQDKPRPQGRYKPIEPQPCGHKNPFAGTARKKARAKKKTQRLARRRQR